ncbi:MAG: hypothetical protein J2P25_01700 [Nocardiopsaceae bacterium]|nr:hypothetical protein [Nocardiopsaceae bacterium]
MTDDARMTDPRHAAGARDFQLRILSGMREGDAMVEAALRRLGADRAEMEASRGRTEGVFLPAGHFENAVALLGAPQESEIIEPPPGQVGQERLTRIAYQLPLWPDLVFCLQGMSGLPILFHDSGFARPAGASPSRPGGWHDLRPWAWLRDEVIEGFGPPVAEGDIWPPYESYAFQGRDSDGNGRQFWAVFSWNLLQHVEWR